MNRRRFAVSLGALCVLAGISSTWGQSSPATAYSVAGTWSSDVLGAIDWTAKVVPGTRPGMITGTASVPSYQLTNVEFAGVISEKDFSLTLHQNNVALGTFVGQYFGQAVTGTFRDTKGESFSGKSSWAPITANSEPKP